MAKPFLRLRPARRSGQCGVTLQRSRRSVRPKVSRNQIEETQIPITLEISHEPVETSVSRRHPAVYACRRPCTRPAPALHLALRIRDPKTNQIVVQTEVVDSAKVAVVIVDPWNFHWCMTACERVSAMVPRWNRAVDCARKLGMPILWAPSDVAGNYAGYPQRERALAVPFWFAWMPAAAMSWTLATG